MSEPSDVEVAQQEDMRLDAQIDEYMEEKRRRRMEDQELAPDDSEPEREPPVDHKHVAIRDGDRMVCTHCGITLHNLFTGSLAEAIGWPTDWPPPALEFPKKEEA